VVSASQVTMISKRKMMSTSASFDLMTSTSSSSSLRHPAIPPIKEEVLSDLYEVVPDPLEPEEEAVCMQQAANRQTSSRLRPRTPHQQQPPSKFGSRWQHRSYSLPAVHGNFILLHRERPSSTAAVSRLSKLFD
jgi:hypothetical protein